MQIVPLVFWRYSLPDSNSQKQHNTGCLVAGPRNSAMFLYAGRGYPVRYLVDQSSAMLFADAALFAAVSGQH